MPRPFSGIPRIYLWFAASVTAITGMSFSGQIPAEDALIISLAGFFVYGFGQMIADCLQGGDCRFIRYLLLRGKGSITTKLIIVVNLAGLAACGVVLASFQPLNIVVLLIGAAGLILYLLFVRQLWIGPWYNVWIVLVLAIVGFISTGARAESLPPGYLWFLGAVCSGYFSLVLTGYVRAIERGTFERGTIPFRLNSTYLSTGSDLFKGLMVACALTGSFVFPLREASITGMLGGIWFLATGTMTLVVPQFTGNARSTKENRQTQLAPSLHAYILILCGVAVLQQPSWVIPLTLLYFTFTTVLRATRTEVLI